MFHLSLRDIFSSHLSFVQLTRLPSISYTNFVLTYMAEEAPHNHAAPDHPHKMTQEDDKSKLRKDQGGAPPPDDYGIRRRRSTSTLCAIIVIFLLLAGITALTVWLLYRPHKPKFRVVSATVYQLNSSSPPLLSTSMQFTMVTRNPNKRVSIYYDHLSLFVTYKQQAITPTLNLPPLFHQTKSTVALSPVVGGSSVPVAADVVNGLMMDEAYGLVSLRVVLTGKLRYKTGAIKTGHYGIYVRCDLLMRFNKGFAGEVPLLGSPPCTVDV